ncbi:MAG TPA: helix-turn-helix transcriptional regulator [Dissulfurispiraceae bacterium]|nr:helix-turn-helix transcriptional regulator [Dissulfurispiraceae bacterium]
MRGRTLKEYIADQMENPEFKRAWEDLDPEFHVLKAMIKAREKAGLSQTELARRVGTKQSVISRLERGGFSKATLETIKKVADALDMRLEIHLRHKKA